MLCASIKVRFIALIKHLKEIKSSQTSFVVNTTTTKYIAVTKSIEKLSQLKEVSLIYDEVLEIILLLNESFSTLLSFAFGTLFLFFTLNSFCTFFMMTTKNFTIFQLIEKAHWILLSAFAIFSLCYTTESTNKAISDCASLLNTIYSHDDFENINHKVEIEIILTKIIIQMESFVFTCGYFDINMKMLHSFVYTSITYLVILLQFNFEEVETSSPPTIAH
ncbi:CLUMA_CG012766, isoform A [Clunio marinus]|uniref:CLUMA_CG012766, isoform A n=1 Tax=Clunio marinus TaxID=568069 RepID=A0A1J1IGI1_9DIPT|nr:CLUMA_CG012766, isoform A [Clunio marinus]